MPQPDEASAVEDLAWLEQHANMIIVRHHEDGHLTFGVHLPPPSFMKRLTIEPELPLRKAIEIGRAALQSTNGDSPRP